MELNLPPQIEASILAAFHEGDFEAMADQIVEAARSTQLKITASQLQSMPDDHDLDKLGNIVVFDASQQPDPGLWPDDDHADDFLDFVRTHRNEEPSVGQ